MLVGPVPSQYLEKNAKHERLKKKRRNEMDIGKLRGKMSNKLKYP